jgi:hypothetical protein
MQYKLSEMMAFFTHPLFPVLQKRALNLIIPLISLLVCFLKKSDAFTGNRKENQNRALMFALHNKSIALQHSLFL